MTSYRRLLLAVALFAACNTNPIVTPVRSFDRPSDVALACVIYQPARDATNMEVGSFLRLPLSRCAPTPTAILQAPGNFYFNPDAIGDFTQAFYPTLRALVANSARGEVALVDVPNARLLDLDYTNPGFNFIPVGRSPESIRATPDGCMAITSNTDSCDLSVIDLSVMYNMGAMLARAPGAAYADKVVRRLELYAGGVPLEARPTQVELVPLPPSSLNPDPEAPADMAGAASNPDMGATLNVTDQLFCASNTYTAWIALPGCEAVVEARISLSGDGARADVTRAIHVGREGATVLTDPASLRCPAECSGGAAPVAVNDSTAPGGYLPATQAAPGTIAIDNDSQTVRMVIGDFFGEKLSLLTLDPATGAPNASRAIALESGAVGVAKVRVSPRTPAGKFIYAMARDGTARVVDLDRELECETNPDPVTLNAQTASFIGGLPPEDPAVEARRLGCLVLGDPSTPVRSPNAISPGISLPNGAIPRDVAFVHLDTPDPALNTSGLPFAAQPQLLVGDFAWLIASDGRGDVVQVYDACPQPNDPQQLPDTSYTPACDIGQNAHASRSNDYVNNFGNPLPLEIERLSHRLRIGSRRFLQPNNQADAAGTARLSDPLNPVDITVFGTPSKNTNTYTYPTLEPVVRGLKYYTPDNFPALTKFVDVADPRVVRDEIWSFAWEGVLPGTHRTFATVCGVGDPTCPRGAVIDAGATLCSRGVLPGDKLELLGCINDSGCLYNQECRTDPNAPIGVTTGLCLDRNVGNTQANRCSAILRAQRRYRIVAPRQQATLPSGDVTDVMELAEIYEPEFAVETKVCDPSIATACNDVFVQAPDIAADKTPLPTKCLLDSDGAHRCLRACSLSAQNSDALCGTGYLCAPSNQSTAAVPDVRCMRSPLDIGLFTDCFHERQNYQIRVGDAFAVIGASSGLLAEVAPDPVTHICAMPPLDSPLSSERIRLRNPRLPLEPPMCPLPLTPATDTQLAIDAVSWVGPGGPNACQYATGNSDHLIHFENPVLALALRIFKNADGGYVPKDDTIINVTVAGGGFPLGLSLGVSGQPTAQAPISAVTAPDQQTVFVVDEGKGTTASALRGQLLRLVSAVQICDPRFLVR